MTSRRRRKNKTKEVGKSLPASVLSPVTLEDPASPPVRLTDQQLEEAAEYEAMIRFVLYQINKVLRTCRLKQVEEPDKEEFYRSIEEQFRSHLASMEGETEHLVTLREATESQKAAFYKTVNERFRRHLAEVGDT